MFDFSWSELLLIGVVALIFIGPKELPGVLRTLGQWMTKVRRMAGDFQNQFQDAMREAELADLKKEVDDMAAQAASYSNFDPLAEVRKDMQNAQQEVESALAGTTAGEPAASEPAAAAPPAPDAAPPAIVPPSLPEAPAAEPDMAPRESVAAGTADEPGKEAVKHAAGGSEPA